MLQPNSIEPQALVIIDVDGLRRDVFRAALAAGELPHIERIVGGRAATAACDIDAASTAPSITFAAQASIVTGAHPGAHGIVGNETFDRHGRISRGRPRHFGFDVGDTLAVDDAVAVFATGLAARFLRAETPTLYERAAARGLRSTVAYNMVARGAETWLPPNVVEIARFTKGRGALGLKAGAYDAGMLDRLAASLRAGPRPDVVMAYFMGLDHHSHLHGPDGQREYLREIIDPQIGRLLDTWQAVAPGVDTLFVIVSDHGQIEAVPDDRHSLRMGFPFDREMAPIFHALNLDVHDFPGEDPHCDAVLGLNGGLAHVYLQRRDGHWADPPRYVADVLPVARAFFEMDAVGRYAPELQGTLDLVLARNVERDGWHAPYEVYTGEDETTPLESYLAQHPELGYVDAANRLRLAASEVSGDLILVAKGREGYYFGAPLRGVHGGLLPGESDSVLVFARPDADAEAARALRETVADVIAARCAREGHRHASIADLVPVVESLLGWVG